MTYTINELAQLAGVTVRTLHHYDAIGLLVPQRDKDNMYRIYAQEDLILLQQILFFRELDFPLQEIKRIIKAKDFEERRALDYQKSLLTLKRKRLNAIIRTINKRIKNMNKDINEKELYKGFSESEIELFKSKTKKRWGDSRAYKESQKNITKMTQADVKKYKNNEKMFLHNITGVMNLEPTDEKVQSLIDQHYNALRTFYEPNLEMYAGLADMYVSDKRFTDYYDKHKVGLAQFMHDAMMVYVNERA